MILVYLCCLRTSRRVASSRSNIRSHRSLLPTSLFIASPGKIGHNCLWQDDVMRFIKCINTAMNAGRIFIKSARCTERYNLEVGEMFYSLRYVRYQCTIIINVRESYNTSNYYHLKSAPLILPAQRHDQLVNLRVGEPGGSGVPLATAPNLCQRVLYQATAARQGIFTARSPASRHALSVLSCVRPRTTSRALLPYHHPSLSLIPSQK